MAPTQPKATTQGERITALETEMGELQRQLPQLHGEIVKISTAVNAIKVSQAEIVSTLAHPARSHCIILPDLDNIRRDIEGLRAENGALRAEVLALKSQRDAAMGGWKVLAWIGGLLTAAVGAAAGLLSLFGGKH
jgi:chromosome segregation ATPase